MLGDSPMLEETLRRLSDTGMRVLHIELMRLVADTSPEDFEATLEAGALLGAGFVTVNGCGPEIERASDTFAVLVELARPYAVRPVIEPIPTRTSGPSRRSGSPWAPREEASCSTRSTSSATAAR